MRRHSWRYCLRIWSRPHIRTLYGLIVLCWVEFGYNFNTHTHTHSHVQSRHSTSSASAGREAHAARVNFARAHFRTIYRKNPALESRERLLEHPITEITRKPSTTIHFRHGVLVREHAGSPDLINDILGVCAAYNPTRNPLLSETHTRKHSQSQTLIHTSAHNSLD